jgi:Family of unknown function (DUF6627)
MAPRLLVRPRIVLPVLLWALVLGFLPSPAGSAPLPPATTASPEADPAALEIRLVLAHLVALGVSPEEASARLAALSDTERHALAQRLDEVEAGGSAAAVLAVIIVLALLVVLTLELMGRRVISRP